MCEVLDKIVAKSEEKKEAQVRETMVIDMLKEKLQLSIIERISKLSEEAIRALATKNNMEVVEG